MNSITQLFHLPNINMDIDGCFSYLKALIHDLNNNEEPSKLLLTTSLHTVTTSIANSKYPLTKIYNYKAKIFEYFMKILNKTQFKNLNISIEEPMTFFIDLRIQLCVGVYYLYSFSLSP